MKIKHVFIDIDRTLWDFEANANEVFRLIYEKHNLMKQIPSLEEFVNTYKEINEFLWNQYRDGLLPKHELQEQRFLKTLQHFQIEDKDLANKIGDDYIYFSPRQTILMPYTHEVLSYLQQKYVLHIITNGFEEVQYLKLKCNNLEQYFQEVIISENAGAMKPSEIIFNYALQQANATAEESIMLGDDLPVDIVGAQQVGMQQIYYNPHKIPHKEKPTYEIECLKEIFEIL